MRRLVIGFLATFLSLLVAPSVGEAQPSQGSLDDLVGDFAGEPGGAPTLRLTKYGGGFGPGFFLFGLGVVEVHKL